MASLPTPAVDTHPVQLTAPFFASGAALTLHRYQETEFIPRFLNELAAGRLTDPTAADWWLDDRFSDHDDRLVLRLPVHRTFYLVGCEVVCDRLGQPALDPARIRSAGFVIRRIGGPAEGIGSKRETRRRERKARFSALKERLLGRDEMQVSAKSEAVLREEISAELDRPWVEASWVVEDGEPVGWQPVVDGGRDPDLGRRPCLNGVLRRGPTPVAYSGEETHPLFVTTARDPAGKSHTLLYGFLPLGGQFLFGGSPFEAADEEGALAADRERLTWPFGYRGRPDHRWQAGDASQVAAGEPSVTFFELLEVLVNRYHLGEVGDHRNDPLNLGLAEAARGLYFMDESAPVVSNRRRVSVKGKGGTPGKGPSMDFDGVPDLVSEPARVAGVPRFSLWDYLEACFAAGEDNPLIPWLADQRRRMSAGGPIGALPARPGRGSEDLGLSMTINAADAEEWRVLLGERLLGQARRTGGEIPIPKFRQEAGDLYQVLPFVRALDDRGRERTTWASPGVRSEPFRVAAPFDPDASRPVLIQMPSLSDLKRGLAKGAAMLVPPDTQRLMDALKLDKGVGPDLAGDPPPEGAGLGIQWICSFSLPVITLVAMILLMIMIIILNLLFFWLPWVRICLPFPKIK